MEKIVHVIFIIPETCQEKDECLPIMHRAYEVCKTNLMSIDWKKATDDFDDLTLEKMDFLVFEKFEGACFERLKTHRVVGPSCLLTCLVEGRPIPNLPWPIFNMAMADCSVTVSHLPKLVKDKIQEKVKFMSGTYTDVVYHTTTHLITDTVKSEKYARASEAGVKVMIPAWVDDVWNASLTGNVHCNDTEFDKYRCPPFYNLSIALTGFSDVEVRTKIADLVKKNGGKFSSQLYVSSTDFLICEESTNSEKYKVARKSKHVKCVTYNWLVDSIEKGYALPVTDYALKKPTSTPTKSAQNEEPNFSIISSIGSTTQRYNNTFQETVLQPFETSQLSETSSRKRKSSSLEDVTDVIDAIDLRAVKKAGSFLDGCCIYLAGFTHDQREKMSRILSLGDATRYDQISERITHIIIGDAAASDVKDLRSNGAPLVSLEWLNECIRLKRVVGEERFLVSLQRDAAGAVSSPLSQKGLKLLRREISVIEPDVTNITAVENQNETLVQPDNGVDIDAKIMEQYKNVPAVPDEEDTLDFLKNQTATSRRAVVNADETSSQAVSLTLTQTDDETTSVGIFQNLKFKIYNFVEEAEENIKACIEDNDGEVVPKNFGGTPDFVVVQTFFNEKLAISDEKIISYHYLLDCDNAKSLLDVEYFHRPLRATESNILEGCVVTTSTYVGSERTFLVQVVEELGGIMQDQLCRVPKPGILASTHLLAPVAEGKKFQAAVKWGLPVLTKDWLLECAKLGRYAVEDPFLIGTSKPSERSNAVKLLETKRETSVIPSTESMLNAFEDGPEENNFTLQGNASNEVEKDDEVFKPQQTTDNSTIKMDNNRDKENITPSRTKPTDPNTSGYITPCAVIMERFGKVNSGSGGSQPKLSYTPLKMDTTLPASSQVTPVDKIMERFRENEMIDVSTVTPPLPRRYGDIDTPDTPLGAFIRPNPSPHLRKELQKWLNKIPEHKPRRDSTPFSELKHRLWDKICPSRARPAVVMNSKQLFVDCEASTESEASPCEALSKTPATPKQSETTAATARPQTPSSSKIDSNLQQLQEMIASNSGRKTEKKKRESILPAHEAPQLLSQVYSVGWDYSEIERAVQQTEPEEEEDRKRIFMITGLDKVDRDQIIRQIQELGGTVSELSNYDPEGTHLITPKPQRTEKILSSMAAGKWILHPSYLQKSIEAGKFLKEDDFEYGNPNALKDISAQYERERDKLDPAALHYWRVEVNKRGYGAFHDMRAIVVASRRDSIVRVIESGGGMVIDTKPPFENVYATHCLIDEKSSPDLSLYVPLAKNGVYCVNVLYISDFLYRNSSDIDDCILPYFKKYYNPKD